MKIRFKQVLQKTFLLLFAGLAYIVLYLNGIQIPCIFHQLTGLYCPGCGISRMCISILRLDFLSALRYNSVIMFLLPVLLLMGMQLTVSYVKTGNKQLSKGQKVLVWIMSAILVLFGVIRNLPQFSFLRPPV